MFLSLRVYTYSDFQSVFFSKLSEDYEKIHISIQKLRVRVLCICQRIRKLTAHRDNSMTHTHRQDIYLECQRAVFFKLGLDYTSNVPGMAQDLRSVGAFYRTHCSLNPVTEPFIFFPKVKFRDPSLIMSI